MTSPTSPYRSETDALRERKGSLERELHDLEAQTSHLDGLRRRQEELAREVASIDARLGANAKRVLPLLDQVRVASPCSANWDEMLGNDQVRFCVSCEKNVYNLSAMPRDEAEQLLQEHTKSEVCVRFYRRADGTLMTSDCPVGLKKKRRKQLAIAVAGASAMALAATTMFRSQCSTTGGVVQGAMTAMGTAEPPAEPPPVVPETASPPAPVQGGVHAMGAPMPMMGKRAQPQPPAVVGRLPKK